MTMSNTPGTDSARGRSANLDPTIEDAYWRGAYSTEPYHDGNSTYDDYAPGYRVGYTGQARNPGMSFEDAEKDLQGDYYRQRGTSRLGWEKAKDAARAAWERVKRATTRDPG